MKRKASEGPEAQRLPPVERPAAVGLDAETQMRPCPICGKLATVKLKPFCSKRCADVDLHRWLGGTYAIPVDEKDRDENDLDDDA